MTHSLCYTFHTGVAGLWVLLVQKHRCEAGVAWCFQSSCTSPSRRCWIIKITGGLDSAGLKHTLIWLSCCGGRLSCGQQIHTRIRTHTQTRSVPTLSHLTHLRGRNLLCAHKHTLMRLVFLVCRWFCCWESRGLVSVIPIFSVCQRWWNVTTFLFFNFMKF